jgi:asparagine synthase (glutamine-hydrolysing)
VGKKPLFVARRGTKVWFASELMALLQDPEIERTPDPEAIAAYLTLQYVPHPMSAFTGVEKLPPASTVVHRADGAHPRQYWSLDYRDGQPDVPETELEDRLRDLIWEATRIRLMSEVPLGAFLSGGIDSSAVVAAMAHQMPEPVKTFSIGFPDADFDELRFARMVAQQYATDHHEFIVEPHALSIMPKLARHYGEPFADSSAIPSFYLAELTSRHVTVALNGDGGDESFAGYRRYCSNSLVTSLDWLPAWMRRLAPHVVHRIAPGTQSTGTWSRVQRLAHLTAMEPHARYAHWMSVFPQFGRDELLQPDFLASTAGSQPEDVIGRVWLESTGRSGIDRMLDTDVNTYLPGDLLVKMDTATMAYSVEGRSPFLDQHVMEFAAALPPQLKLRGMRGKVLLKSTLRGLVPDEILHRPKMGFGVPLGRWFREELRDLPAEALMGSDSRIHAYVKPAAVAALIREHQEGSADHSSRLWALLQLELWHREVVESPLLARRAVERLGQEEAAALS